MKTSFTENNKIRYKLDTNRYCLSYVILSKAKSYQIVDKPGRGIRPHQIKIHFQFL